jgi:hypothetical protein
MTKIEMSNDERRRALIAEKGEIQARIADIKSTIMEAKLSYRRGVTVMSIDRLNELERRKNEAGRQILALDRQIAVLNEKKAQQAAAAGDSFDAQFRKMAQALLPADQFEQIIIATTRSMPNG